MLPHDDTPNIDGRSYDHDRLERIRIDSVKRVLAGESPEIVIRSVGFSRSRIYDWLRKYREGGMDALKAKKVTGRPPILTSEQNRELYKLVHQSNPSQFGHAAALWDLTSLNDVVQKHFGIRMTKGTLKRILNGLNLPSTRPTVAALLSRKLLLPQSDLSDVNFVYDYLLNKAKEESAKLMLVSNHLVAKHEGGNTQALCGIPTKGECKFMTMEIPRESGRIQEFLNKFCVFNQHKLLFVDCTDQRIQLTGHCHDQRWQILDPTQIEITKPDPIY